ncbi:hypothetical protein EON67_10770 [archaeon]|nr:MAG: hypothetical protein EON67_10770 [archaeon]
MSARARVCATVAVLLTLTTAWRDSPVRVLQVQHTSIVEWLELFDYPLRVDLHADDVYPLPPRIPY